MKTISEWKTVLALSAMTLLPIVAVQSARAQNAFSYLYAFCPTGNCTDGEFPQAAPIQATDGNLYGTTTGGGANSVGTVFRITPTGTLTTLYSFCSQTGCADGGDPEAGLIQASDGNLYGTTAGGGGSSNPSGTVFRVTPTGTLTTLYSFCSQTNCADGANPKTGLIQATNGNLYGTTSEGGTNFNSNLCSSSGVCGGTIFQITPTGTLTTLYSFCSQINCTDGYNPGGLIQATDGNLYGTTASTFFRITLGGTLTTLSSLAGNGSALVQGTDGNFYGTGSGTVFKLTPDGTRTSIYTFCSYLTFIGGNNVCLDGQNPYGALIQATDGNFYGTTASGGTNTFPAQYCQNGCGTIFEITPSGTLRTLFNTEGGPSTALIQAANGTFYGTTPKGGSTTLSTAHIALVTVRSSL